MSTFKNLAMRKLFILSLILISNYNFIFAEDLQPIKWDIYAQELTSHEFLLSFDAKIDKGWCLYSQHIKTTAPLPTSVVFTNSDEFTRIGEIEELGTPIKKFDDMSEQEITKYESHVILQMRVKTQTKQTLIKGYIEFMTCHDGSCLAPQHEEFSFDLVSNGHPKLVSSQTNTRSVGFKVVEGKKYGADSYNSSDQILTIPQPSYVSMTKDGKPITNSIANLINDKSFYEIFNFSKNVQLESSGNLVISNAVELLSPKSTKKPEKILTTEETQAILNQNKTSNR